MPAKRLANPLAKFNINNGARFTSQEERRKTHGRLAEPGYYFGGGRVVIRNYCTHVKGGMTAVLLSYCDTPVLSEHGSAVEL